MPIFWGFRPRLSVWLSLSRCELASSFARKPPPKWSAIRDARNRKQGREPSRTGNLRHALAAHRWWTDADGSRCQPEAVGWPVRQQEEWARPIPRIAKRAPCLLWRGGEHRCHQLPRSAAQAGDGVRGKTTLLHARPRGRAFESAHRDRRGEGVLQSR